MGLFSNLFGSSNEKESQDTTPWIDLTLMEQLEGLKESSKTKTQLIFKHSTRCGVSRMVMNQFKKDYILDNNDADLYYLDLIDHRDVSNAIASQFDVHHESPQLLVIKNGVVVRHASHGRINELELDSFL